MALQIELFFNRGAMFIVLIFILNSTSFAQSFKYWFLNQGGIDNNISAVGYTENSTLSDTSVIKNAFRNAVMQLAEQKKVEIKFDISHLTGGSVGTAQMDYNYKQNIDTTLVDNIMASAKIIDTMRLAHYSAVLITVENKELKPYYKTSINIKQIQPPEWINNIPQDEKYFYATGSAQKYYYEISSWRAAENEAIKNLASQINSTIKSVIKSDESFEEIRVQNTFAQMQDVEIMNRFYDTRNKIYYVLVRVNKNNVCISGKEKTEEK